MIYLRFIITLAKGVFDLQIDKKKKNTKLWKKKPSTYIVKIFYMWMLCITLKERNTERFVQNWHSPKSPWTEWSWFFLIVLVMFFLFATSWIITIFKECLIKSRNSHCLYAHKLYFNAWKLFQKWKKLQNVRHIHNVFKFSTFLN